MDGVAVEAWCRSVPVIGSVVLRDVATTTSRRTSAAFVAVRVALVLRSLQIPPFHLHLSHPRAMAWVLHQWQVRLDLDLSLEPRVVSVLEVSEVNNMVDRPANMLYLLGSALQLVPTLPWVVGTVKDTRVDPSTAELLKLLSQLLETVRHLEHRTAHWVTVETHMAVALMAIRTPSLSSHQGSEVCQ